MLDSNKLMIMPYILGVVAFHSLQLRPWIRNKPLNDLHTDNQQPVTVILLAQAT